MRRSRPPGQKERKMLTLGRNTVSIFVDRLRQQWIVRDSDGRFWIVPSVENAWDHREPLDPDLHVELEPVPRHYKYLLDLPL